MTSSCINYFVLTKFSCGFLRPDVYITTAYKAKYSDTMIYRSSLRYAPATYKLRQPSHFSTLLCCRHVVPAPLAGSLAVMSLLRRSFIIAQYCHQTGRRAGACSRRIVPNLPTFVSRYVIFPLARRGCFDFYFAVVWHWHFLKYHFISFFPRIIF